MIIPSAHIADMSPYALAELSAPAGKTLISLSQNESLRPPSPRAVAAAVNAAGMAHLYPDPDWAALRTALSNLHGIPFKDILCGNGSMELIACVTQAFVDQTGAVLAPAHAYPFFKTATLLAQARFDVAPEVNCSVCVDALLAAVRPDTRIIFLANPANPTGTRIPLADLCRLRESLHDDILLVIDEAYGEFADHLGEPSFDLVEHGNTVVLRSLSKAYGLAGMRVGWGVFPPAIACEMRKVMNPNNISVTGQAMAAAAVKDQAYMQQTCAQTAALRDDFAKRLHVAGFQTSVSFTNFVLIHFDNAGAARRADAFLRAKGVFLRPQAGVGLPQCLRATIASKDKLDIALALLDRWKAEEPA
ncbi:MAG: histidinol-phosphate transaminase [Roseobacter sp.]